MLTAAQMEAIFRLFLALISGGILGYERTSKRVDAGFRTHIFVCMCSCAVMITNIDIYLLYKVGDPTRMPAQVISGVGFLGAGCILVTGQRRIKGVTTAAGIWAAACLGLCIGAGDYIVSAFVLIIAILAMTVFRAIDEMIATKTKYMRLFVELESVSAISAFMNYMHDKGIRVNDTEFIDNKKSESVAIVITIQLKEPDRTETVISEFEKVGGVLAVMEV